ncbi:MAG: tRNA lysidine(34) synthetase TilS [Pseudomonadota bacterium]
MAVESSERSEPLSHSEFKTLIADMVDGKNKVGLAVSGGPDSMALGFLLSHWAKDNDVQVCGVTVDHDLRKGSDKEAEKVKAWTKDWPNFSHQILKWEGDKPQARVMEEARKARYALMQDYFKNVSVRNLFLAHHLDDQAETILIRLAKGSGLDGLSGMKAKQQYAQNDAYSLTFLRPLLGVEKQRLIATCKHFDVPFVDDPSNENDKFLRPRLREARAILEAEGLSNKRLATTARRLDSARIALDEIAQNVFEDSVIQTDSSIVIKTKSLEDWPFEIGFRVFLKAMRIASDSQTYGPRMEKLESLYSKIVASHDKVKETLGGCIVVYNPQDAEIILKPE